MAQRIENRKAALLRVIRCQLQRLVGRCLLAALSPALVGAVRRGLGGWFVLGVGVFCLVASAVRWPSLRVRSAGFACLGAVRFVGRLFWLRGVSLLLFSGGIAVQSERLSSRRCPLPPVTGVAVLR
jgi:hypothetical protein